MGPRTGPRGLRHLAGLSEVTVDGVDVGGSTVLRLPTVYRYNVDGFVVVDGSEWTLLPSANVATDPNGYWTDLTLTDGGVGDLDGAANGSIFVRGARIYYEDTAPPVVQCDPPPTGWSAEDVSVSCIAFDLGSGIPNPDDDAFEFGWSPTCPPAPRPTTHKHRPLVCDNSFPGLCTTAGPIGGIKVDKRDPSIDTTLPPGATVEQGGTLEADFSCADGGSGVASCVGTVDDGDLARHIRGAARTRSRSSPPTRSATRRRVRSSTSSRPHGDDDGISDAVENAAPNGGDGNGDGTPIPSRTT